MTQKCTKCGLEKSLDKFYKGKNQCKECYCTHSRIYRQIYYPTHKEKIKFSKQAYYQVHKEEQLASSLAYYQTHKKERKEYQQKYQQNHKKESQTYCCNYYQSHKDKQRTLYQVRKILLFNHYGRTCKCCGLTLPQDLLTIDHTNNDGAEQRKKKGGRNQGVGIFRLIGTSNIELGLFPKDLQTMCMSCNFAKRFGHTCPCNHGQVFIDAVKQLEKEKNVKE